jgi:hypothetical protein
MWLVMRGLDPRIHLFEKMDCRIESGNDDLTPASVQGELE